MQSKKKYRTGFVISNKMNKTIVVKILRSVRHRLYGKSITYSSKLKVHDENNEAKIGNFVLVKETRPLSADKRWFLKKIY